MRCHIDVQAEGRIFECSVRDGGYRSNYDWGFTYCYTQILFTRKTARQECFESSEIGSLHLSS